MTGAGDGGGGESRRRAARIATAAVVALGAIAVWTVATQVFPYHSLNHDEGVYLQQAAMLLEGRLFLRPPVEDVMRPWFFVEDGDRLYSKYSPVPAAIFAIGRLLGGYRLALVGVAAGNLALVALVVGEVFDRWTGVLATVFVCCSPLFLIGSAVFLPYAPTTLLNLLFAYGYLRADRSDDPRWAAVAGAAIGLAFFARPFTAVLFAAPFVVHALWTLRADLAGALPRQIATAALGLAGVGVTLLYNAATTGSPLRFPYEAFGPQDGLGFGHRELLGHEVTYTPELALRANGRVLDLLLTEWIAGGVLGAALAGAGVALVLRRGASAREAVMGGLLVSVAAGNVYFWGNLNVLGALERPGDGLVSVLGPYYHFDLLFPLAAFAAVGALRGGRLVRRGLDRRLDAKRARVAFAVLLLVSATAFGAVTVGHVDHRLEENLEATRTYEVAYEPFEAGPPANAVVLVPGPYGPWLNHPFQPLRNDPGFDGRTVYAVDDRPFATADAFPDRELYRYVFRGAWAPHDGSPEAARLRRVRDVSAPGVALETTVGIPDGAVGVTVRAATEDGRAHYVAREPGDALDLRLLVADDEVRVAGDVRPVDDGTAAVEGRDVVRLTVFVDYGPGGGFSYRFEMPVDATGAEVRALSPRIERCRDPRACGGAAAHVPETAPDGVFVGAELSASEPNT